MKNKINKHFKKAFTLVELIIVIAVIALLAVFLIPNFSNVLGDTQVTQVKNDTKQVQQVVQAYINQTGAVPVRNSNPNKTTHVLPNEVGISRATFQANAKTDEYYVIDMDSLTRNHKNIDDNLTKVSAMLTSVPSTSAVKDVYSDTNFISAKSIKNTSVVYVIDADLNVYAAWSKNIKKNDQTNGGTFVRTGFRVFNTNAAKDTDETFKMQYQTIADNKIVYVMNADDSNYIQ